MKKAQTWVRLIISILCFLAFFAANAFLESADQLELTQASCSNPGRDTTPPFYDSVYTAFLKWMGNEASSQVSIIAIKADLDDIQQNLCNGRSYMADLLTTIATQHPSAIVIDRYFSPTSCAQTPASTGNLIAAVRSLKVPVVLGESTDIASQEADDSCLVQKQQLEFVGSNVHHGLLRLNANREQIPLRWPVLPQQPPAPRIHSTKMPSLALESVSIFAPQLIKTESFERLLSEKRQPYARIGLDPLPETTSTALLCTAGTPGIKKRWSLHCSATEQKADLLGKLVVVGAENEVDHWVVLGKPMWGFQLQAGYIDSLLSGRYLHAAPSELVLGLFGGFLLFLDVLPILADWCFFLLMMDLPTFLKPSFWWHSFIFLIFVILTVLGFLSRHYLPPLLMLFGAFMTYVAHILIEGSKWAEDRVRPKRESEVKL